jgi:hypothetical protein
MVMARAIRSGDGHETSIGPDPASEADLYQLEPGQFTSARNALAKRMRAADRPDEAARIGKLRRPPVTAWALNQLSRRRPDLIGAVLEAGGQLRSAMEKAVAGDASGLRDAQVGQRRAVDAAVGAAAEGLEAAGHPGHEMARQRMAATLGAAVVDTEVAQQLRDGLLDGDRSAAGFGLDGMSMPQRPSTPRVRAGTVPAQVVTEAEADADGTTREAEGDRARRAEQTAERERRRQARARYAELDADATRLALRAERLQARAEDAQRRAAEARAAAQAAKKEADEARRRAERARPDERDERVR